MDALSDGLTQGGAVLQGVDGGVDDGRDEGGKVGLLFVHPHVDQAAGDGVQVVDGEVDVEVGGQFAAVGAGFEDAAQLLFPQADVFLVRRHNRPGFFGELTFGVEDDDEAAVQGVVLDVVEDVDEHAAQAAAVGLFEAGGEGGATVGENLLEQGFEQIFFVFEMPIERAACDAGVAGDGGKRGAGNAVFEEGVEGGLQKLLAGFLGFGFGFAHWGDVVAGCAGIRLAKRERPSEKTGISPNGVIGVWQRMSAHPEKV